MKIIDQLRDLRSLDSSPEEEMKRFILSLASELRLDEGHALPPNVLMHRTINLHGVSGRARSFGTFLDKLICRLNLERVLGRLSNQYFKERPIFHT